MASIAFDPDSSRHNRVALDPPSSPNIRVIGGGIMVGLAERMDVWKRAMDLMVETYALADRLPSPKASAMADQMRRAASSIPANIAEGNARAHRKEYLHFLAIARGSLAELSTHFESARRLRYLRSEELEPARDLITRVSQMLNRLVNRLQE